MYAPMNRLPHARIHFCLIAIGAVAGMAGLFLPFTWGTSPFDELRGGDWQVALPALLPAVVAAVSTRWAMADTVSRSWRHAAYSVAAASMGLTLWAVVSLLTDGAEGAAYALIPVLTLCLGGYLMIGNAEHGQASAFNPGMAVQVAYLAHAWLCLAVFWDLGWDAGAYCVLVATIAYVLQIALVSAQHRSHAVDRGSPGDERLASAG